MFSRLVTSTTTIQRLRLNTNTKCVTASTLFSERKNSDQKSSSTTKDLLLPKLKIDHRRFASAFSISKMVTQIGTNSKNILLGVDFNELRKAPPAAFWVTTAGGALFLTPPVLEILFGYSSFLTTLEVGQGIAFLSMLGTMKWGHCLERKGSEGPTWDNLTWSMVPPGVAVFCFLLPETIGLMVLTGGIGHALYMDITHYSYPSWANALGCYISTIAIISLALTTIGHIVFS